MQRGIQALLAGLFLLCSGAVSAATDEARLLMQLESFYSDEMMMIYDETDQAANKLVRSSLAALEEPVQAWLGELEAADAELARKARNNWAIVKRGIDDGKRGGMTNTGYDAPVHAEVQLAVREISGVLQQRGRLDKLGGGAGAALRASRVVKDYLEASATPFGSYTASANESDADLPAQVNALDSALAELGKSVAGDAERAEAFRRVNAKWQFIRGTVLRVGSQSTPFIVYRYGREIVDELQKL